jgi:hypothetical protein
MDGICSYYQSRGNCQDVSSSNTNKQFTEDEIKWAYENTDIEKAYKQVIAIRESPEYFNYFVSRQGTHSSPKAN